MEQFCEITLDRERLKNEVRTTYSLVAEKPTGDFHFHRGPDYAARQLGYDAAELASLPGMSTAAFAGVGNPFRVRDIPAGASVIDLGSGAGMDCLLAGRRVGRDGRVVGVDMTDAMLEVARSSAEQADMPQVSFAYGEITDLPVDAASVDLAISNGVVNLAIDKAAVFRELYRVLKPGGWIQFADIVTNQELSLKARNDIDLWVGWIAGALQSAGMIEMMQAAGFQACAATEYFDSFAGTSKENIARKYGVRGANFIAYKQ